MDAYVRRVVDLRGYGSATLTWWHKIPSIESPLGGDCAAFKINSGVVRSWSAAIADWTPATVDLSSYAGSLVTIEGLFHSNATNHYEGWDLDNISIEGCPESPTQTWPPDGEIVRLPVALLLDAGFGGHSVRSAA